MRFALDVGELEQVIGGGAGKVRPKVSPAATSSKPRGKCCGGGLVALGAVHARAVGRDGDDHVIRAEARRLARA